MPHVLLNGLLLDTSPTYRGAGISHYEQQLIAALADQASGWDITAVVSDSRWSPPAGVQAYCPLWPTKHPIARILWEQAVLPLVLHRVRPTVYHGLAYVGPLASDVPQVITVHDLAFVRFPETLPPWKARYLRWFTRLSVRKACKVIAVSENTRQDVLHWTGLPPEKVVTVYNGVSPHFRPLPPMNVARWRQSRGLPERFLLYLGTLEPRKNLATLLRAFALWRQEAPPGFRDVVLVLAGAKGWYTESLFSLVRSLQLAPWVYFPGYVPSEELVYWYNAAIAFVYPSRFEGFGLPVLEAMACGSAVIAAKASSLPEIVGEAGVLVDPDDVQAWVKALDTVIRDQELRAELGQRARERSRLFSWQRTAKETLAVYEAVRGGL